MLKSAEVTGDNDVSQAANKDRPAREDLASPAESLDFEVLFKQHWTQICGVLYRLAGDWVEAEDLALETFWRLYQNPPRQDHSPSTQGPAGQSLSGWLYRVATNLGFNALRARKRRQRYEEEAGYQVNAGDPSWDPVEEIERGQECERVRAVLAQMKPRAEREFEQRYRALED